VIVLLVVFGLVVVALLAVIAVLLADARELLASLVKLEEEDLHGRIEGLTDRLAAIEGSR
jgi:hypothetical protein